MDISNNCAGEPARPEAFASTSNYGSEYLAAFDRSERFGFKVPPRIRVRKDCVAMSAVMPVLLDFYEENSPEDLIGQTLAIHFELVPRLYKKTRIPFVLTIGWMTLAGKPIFPHDDQVIQGFIDGGHDAWLREGLPFHL